MKQHISSKTIFWLLPLLMMHVLYPRVNQNRLFDIMAQQPSLVYSFVWIPLLEVSVLIAEKALPTATIENTGKDEQVPGMPTPLPVSDNCEYLFSSPAHTFFAISRKCTLPLLKFTPLCNTDQNPLRMFLFLTFLPLLDRLIRRPILLHCRQALPRGDPPALLFA